MTVTEEWIWRGGGLFDTGGRRWGVWIAPLVLTVAAAYWFLPNTGPGTVAGEYRQLELSPQEPADWRETLVAGSMLRRRVGSHGISNGAGSGLWKWWISGDGLVVLGPHGPVSAALEGEAGSPGRLELVEGGTEFLPVGAQVDTGNNANPERAIYAVVLTAEHFAAAQAAMGHNGRAVIAFVLTPDGDERLAAHTVQEGYYLCLLLDGRVAGCPVVRTPLVERRGAMEFLSNVTLAQAQRYAALLNSGPLPVTLRRTGE